MTRCYQSAQLLFPKEYEPASTTGIARQKYAAICIITRVSMRVLLILILFAGTQATSVEVGTGAELRDAFEDTAVQQIIVAAKVLHIDNWPVVRIARAVSVHGLPGSVLDFKKADKPVIEVDAAGSLRLSSLILDSGPGVLATSAPSQHINSRGGRVWFDDVVFYSNGHGAPVLQAGGEFSIAHNRRQQPISNEQILRSRISRLANTDTGYVQFTGCSSVLDVWSCYTAGSALAFDSASLHDALSHPQASRITVMQDITLQSEHCNSRQPLSVERSISITGCRGAVLNLSGLESCWLVSSEGLLQFGPGLQLSHTAPHRRSDTLSSGTIEGSIAGNHMHTTVINPYSRLLLSAVAAVGGAVVMKDVDVQLSEATAHQLHVLHTQAAEEAIPAPIYRVTSRDSIKVLQWCSTMADALQEQQQPSKVLQPPNAVVIAPQQQRLFAATRRLQQRQNRRLQDRARTAQRQLLAPAPADLNQTAGLPEIHEKTTPANSHWNQANPGAPAVQYSKEACFPDFRFLAKDITDFVRLIKDPASQHIELVGNLVFTEDLFPPANANNQSLGINVTQKVTIRACTGDRSNPIIVDVNNLQQQIYVYGEMRWEGNIKFINSYPSQRRAGLFPLISILSVEGNGIVWFEDLQIHGNEPCPLFDLNDPFWDRYGKSPLSKQFVPQSNEFELISSREILLYEWTFNKTAWVLNSQGTQGVVKAVGHGYWRWVDVLVTWSPDEPGPNRAALTAAVVVPVVVVCTAAAALGLLFWRRRHRKQAAMTKEGSSYSPSHGSQVKAGELGGFSTTTTTAVNLRHASTFDSVGSKTDNTSFNTQELIEEARRRMQDAGRKDANIVLEGLLGEGTFGKVYRGVWQGTTVAVKTMLFPAAMSGKEKREKMAIMETAISSSLSHPNIVQTYTYVVKPLTGQLAMQAMERNQSAGPMSCSNDASDPAVLMGSELGENHGWEVRLVLELCDKGSLKELLNAGGLRTPEGKPDMAAIVATAMDVARAMLHLHSESIIHSDLKARNVLLKAAGSDVRGFVAKVSDFGLSVRMDPTETHVSNVYQGTLTHMAPEVLMYGKISRASDVYAFGILMWELYTAQQAFKGTPRVLLGHEVTKMGHRPEFPPDCPFDYQLLACRCWESDAAIRPSFQQILADLQRMASKLRLACSASSLPLLAQQAVGIGALKMQSAGSAAAAATPASVAVLPGSAAPGGIDPTKLHNWEPQTSLLDLRSVDSTQGSSLPEASASGTRTQTDRHAPNHTEELSWGTQSAGGLWLGGEFAPCNLPSDVQLPVHGDSDQFEQAAAGLQPEAIAPEAAAAAAARQQQVPAGTPSAWAAQWPGLAGPAAAGAVDMQPQQLHAHHPFVANICQTEDLQDEKELQQRQQQLLHLPAMDETRSTGPNSLSSSGVFLEDQSSTMFAGSYDDSAEGSLGGTAYGGLPNAAATLSASSHHHNNMATIVEEADGQVTSNEK